MTQTNFEVSEMSFLSFLTNKALGQPVVPSLELLNALNYSPSVGTFSAVSSLDEILTERPLDLRTFGAITPEPRAEDCMTSSELKKAVDEDYQLFGIERYS